MPMFMHILDKNHSYAQRKTVTTYSKQREAVVQKARVRVGVGLTVAQLNECMELYTRLEERVQDSAAEWEKLSARLKQLKLTVDDHCFVREMQLKEEVRRRRVRVCEV